MGNYQKFKGNPEQKLFYLLSNFIGGINTEFSDDNSNDVDFDSIINFNMDRLGTLSKRGGFGELTAISEIFNTLSSDYLPNIKNRTERNLNPENENDNVVYMKLLRNDNNCFRALSGFSGEDAYKKYQDMYGFQDNQFDLLIITTSMVDGVGTSSKVWYYHCELPERIRNGNNITETLVFNCYTATLPVIFNWDRNLMNLETIEFYDKIYFTGNDKCVVTFDRSATITSNTQLLNAFTYSGFSEYISGVPSITNSAHVPSGLEIRHIGFNVLCDDPMHSIDTQGISTDSIQGLYVCTSDNIPLLSLPLGQKFLLNIIYTGTDNGFEISMKEGDNDLTFSSTVNSTLSRDGLKVYDIKFNDVPSGEVEIKIVKTGASSLEPYYDYYDVAQPDKEAKAVTKLNVGDYGICEMYNRAVYYKDDTIWFSDVNNFSYIPNYNYVTLPIEPTDKITKICYFKKAYIIFTKQKIYKMVSSFGTSDFAVQPVNTSLGCHAGNTVVPIEDTLYFSSPRGLYALRSSQFVEGFENVKELDLKVKKLTSDFTMYDDELDKPAIRFNGVSERAYATRYKDKYLLFYNNYNDKGDYAAVNGLDVLVYQFELGAFTTYRFKEKPTFLFMVDNAIETLATVEKERLYDEENDILEYDFTEASGTTIIDLSGNGHTGIIKGGDGITPKKGITLDGENSKVVGGVKNIDFSNGFNVKVDIENLNTTDRLDYPLLPIFQVNNDTKTYPDFTEESRNSTTVTYGDYGIWKVSDVLSYKFKQLSTTVTQVTPVLSLTISSVDLRQGTLTYSLKANDGYIINETTTSFVFDDGFTKTITLPSFVIHTDNDIYYEDEWLFNVNYASIGLNFELSHIQEFFDNISLVNMAYGGTSISLPFYQLQGELLSDGTLQIDLNTTDSIDFNNVNFTNNYSLNGSYIYDFNTVTRQTLEIKFIEEGLYLKCSCYINGEKVEDLGYFPINVFSNLPSKAYNFIKIGWLENYNLEEPQIIYANIYYIETTINGRTSKFNLTEGEGDVANDFDGYYSLSLENCEWLTPSTGIVFDGENTYLEIPTLPATIPLTQGFKVEFEGSFANNINAKIFDFATTYNNDKAENKNASINCAIEKGKVVFSTNSLDYKSYSLTFGDFDITENHKYIFTCVYNLDKTYTLSLYLDDDIDLDVPTKSIRVIGGISDVVRTSNFLGKSNTTSDLLLKGNLKNFKFTNFINTDELEYRTAVYEFDTTTTDFNKDVYVELISKGLNMKYPQHLKKLKHIFVKAIGGDNYGEFFFELYADGHRINDPRIFYAYLDENGTVVYDYTGEKILTLSEVNSLLGNIRLDKTKLGEGKYQTKKLIIPKKAKNFSCRLYGNTNDYLSIESLGFVCKLGKVKEG